MIKEILSEDAYKLSLNEPSCYIIDVRTEHEWSVFGAPILPSKGRVILLTSRMPNETAVNRNFLNFLEKKVVNKKSPMLFICKSGVRSMEAAILAQSIGYTDLYNIFDGFLGNSFGLGWKNNKLPISYNF